MKGMPLPFEFERKGVVALRQQAAAEVVVPCANKVVGNKKRKYINNNNSEEPKSVLDNINSSPSPPTSTSTLSSSFTGGGGGQTVGLAAVSNVGVFETHHRHQPLEQSLSIAVNGGGGGETVGLAAVSNVGVFETHHRHQLLEPSPDTAVDGGGGDQKCGEMEDWESVMSESGQEQSILRWIMGDVEDPSMGLNKMLHGGGTADGGGGFGVVDQGYVRFDSNNPISQIGSFYPQKTGLSSNPPLPPPAEMYGDQNHQNPLQLLQQKPSSIKKMAAIDELGGHKQQQQQQQQQSIIDQLFIVADTIHNPILAQAILARLNHQLSPIGKPFDRAAFYFKEALQLLLHSLVNNMNPQISPIGSPFSLIFKIGAYKSFSEISPFVHFANFTCNQALLENLDGFDQVHIVDFDLGYGDQWASLMQELALRSNTNGVSIKITAFASPTTHDHLELSLTRDSLVNFANEINVGFDFEIVNIDVLASASASWSLPFHVSNNEAVAVNLPINAFSNYQIPFPLVLRFVKILAPKIVVSVDRGCERTDLPFPNHLIHALQSYSNLLESLDAVNMNLDVLQKIERFLIQPSIEKILTGRYSFPEKTQHWRAQFLSVGFSPLTFSNFTESQAVCMIKRAPVRGFHIEKRQSSLVLCWQRRELVSASAWRC